MSADEYKKIIQDAENYFGKQLSDGMHRYYYDAFKKLNKVQFRMLIAIAIQELKFFPKIAELKKIQEEVKINKGDEPIEKEDCKICNGDGFIQYYKKDKETGYPYLYVARCTCSNAYYYSSYPLITEITDGMLVRNNPIKVDKAKVMEQIGNILK